MSQELFNSLNLSQFQSDSDESLISKGGGSRVFGLNQGVTITSVDYRDTDQQGNPSPSINIELADKDGGKFFYSIYGNIQVYDANNQVRTDTSSADYREKYAKEFAQLSAVLTHFASKAVGHDVYKAKYEEAQKAGKFNSIGDILKFAANAMNTLVINKTPLDAFLHYQWNIKGDRDRTFLELPKNMKTGLFLAKDTTGTEWTEVRDQDGLHYVNSKGDKHEFTRTKNFLDQPYAKQQVKDKSSDLEAAAASMTSNPTANTSWI